MNNKSRNILCCVGLFSILLNPVNLMAASDSASQTLKITIPKIALVDIDKTQHAFVFTPTNNIQQHNSQVALSSNDRNARLNIQVDGLPRGLTLKVGANADLCKKTTMQTIQSNKSFSCLVGMNRTRNGNLTFTSSRANQQTVPDGTYTASITYTLSD